MRGLFGGMAGVQAGRFMADKSRGAYVQDDDEEERRQPRGLIGGARNLIGNVGNYLQAERGGVSNLDRLAHVGAMMRDNPNIGIASQSRLDDLRLVNEQREAAQRQQVQERTQGKADNFAMRQRYQTAIERGYSPEIADMYAQSPDDFFQLARQNFEAANVSPGQTRIGGAFGPDRTIDDPIGEARLDLDRRNIASQIEDRAADNRRADAQAERDARGGGIDPSTLRTEFEDDYARPYETAQDQFASMRELAGDATGASDTALIFSFFKTIDPSSTVREGEFALAAQAMGLSDRLVAQLRRADNGQILVGDARDELVTAASRALERRANTVRRAQERYQELAGQDNSRLFRDPVQDDLFSGSLDSRARALGVTMDEVRATARNRGLSEQDVLDRLESIGGR